MLPRFAAVLLSVSVLAGGPAIAGSHTWLITEIFSNADGTIQFVELQEDLGGDFETAVGFHTLTSNSVVYDIMNNVAPPTGFRYLLFGTQAFSNLPGAPVPDEIIPANFLSVGGDSISYVPYDTVTFGAGVLPTDGVMSIGRDLTTSVNSPTNYAGATGSVNANPAPPAVPDGSGISMPMTVDPLDATGSSLSISWDTATCTGAMAHHIIYGEGSQLPASPGGTFGVTGSVCAVGTSSPVTWSASPSATDGTGLIWWVLVVDTGSGVESSWGLDSAGGQRNGPGPSGSSGQCGVTGKNVTNTCGQ